MSRRRQRAARPAVADGVTRTAYETVEVWPDGGAQVAFVNDTHHLYDPAFGDVEERPANVTIVDASRD